MIFYTELHNCILRATSKQQYLTYKDGNFIYAFSLLANSHVFWKKKILKRQHSYVVTSRDRISSIYSLNAITTRNK